MKFNTYGILYGIVGNFIGLLYATFRLMGLEFGGQNRDIPFLESLYHNLPILIAGIGLLLYILYRVLFKWIFAAVCISTLNAMFLLIDTFYSASFNLYELPDFILFILIPFFYLFFIVLSVFFVCNHKKNMGRN
ncbi:hypothetical protein [Bacillus cereus]|uniref:Uncharacterized protein n=1 Tax=Bacillus cereus TaxID=1396 RepID=A0A9X7M3R5_BACCE|nr:hypothetical protein [Bacillus cereus]QDZ77488.1 hypothetical protein D0437_33125 [Bacillus cereus]